MPAFVDAARQHIQVLDDAVPDPTSYRQMALSQPFGAVDAGPHRFLGIASCADRTVPQILEAVLPGVCVTLSFFRQSSEGQPEPNLVHTDADMGQWTGILYLNPRPPAGDGTTFWRHRHSGAISSVSPVGDEGHDLTKWDDWWHADARFNRLIVFPAIYFHSRGLPQNYGQGEDARLIQVVFGSDRTWAPW